MGPGPRRAWPAEPPHASSEKSRVEFGQKVAKMGLCRGVRDSQTSGEADPSQTLSRSPHSGEQALWAVFTVVTSWRCPSPSVKSHILSVAEHSRSLLASGENPLVLLLALDGCHPAHCPGTSPAAQALKKGWGDLNLGGPFLSTLVIAP